MGPYVALFLAVSLCTLPSGFFMVPLLTFSSRFLASVFALSIFFCDAVRLQRPSPRGAANPASQV
jgi:hypothetical protein